MGEASGILQVATTAEDLRHFGTRIAAKLQLVMAYIHCEDIGCGNEAIRISCYALSLAIQ